MRRQYAAPPPMVIDPEKRYYARLRTKWGTITVELFAKDAPRTVNNFVFLAREGFYDGLTFHRVVPGLIIQGGCPRGDGRGGPGYRFADEIAGNPHRHDPGALSMATYAPDSNGSQFFIAQTALPRLNGHHTVFGRVIEGMDVVLLVQQGDEIQRVEIIEKDDDA